MRTGTPRSQDQPANTVVGSWIQQRIRSTLSALSFWSAVLLPLLYLPILLHGPNTAEGRLVFLGLVGLHLVSVIGGRNYHRDSRHRGERTPAQASE